MSQKYAGAQDAYEQLVKAAAQGSPPATTGAAVHTEPKIQARHTEDKGEQHEEQRRTPGKLTPSARNDTAQSAHSQDKDATSHGQEKEQPPHLVDTPSWREYKPPAGVVSLDLAVLSPASHRPWKKARGDANAPLFPP